MVHRVNFKRNLKKHPSRDGTFHQQFLYFVGAFFQWIFIILDDVIHALLKNFLVRQDISSEAMHIGKLSGYVLQFWVL